MSTGEWGASASPATLDQMNMRRMVRKLADRMIDVVNDLPRRSDRHLGYRLRRRVERDAMFGLVNQVTDLNVRTQSVHRRKKNVVIVLMTSTLGPVTFTAWDRRG